MTAFDVFMNLKDNVKAQLVSKSYTQVRSAVIISDIVKDTIKYRISVLYADGSHPFENADLRAELAKALRDKDFKCSLIEIPFGRPVKQTKSENERKDKNKNSGTEK